MNKPEIQVIIRKRPLTKKEQRQKKKDIIDIETDYSLIVREIRKKVDLTKYIERHKFAFDAVFDERSDNQEIYEYIIKPLVSKAFKKSKVSVIAYGQTGSGKTFTMMGDPQKKVSGLYVLAAQDIFELIEQEEHQELMVGLSFYEIYCGKAFDLLNSREACPIRVDKRENVNIVGLKEKIVPNVESLMDLIDTGLAERITQKTGMNNASSRSHAILQISLRKKETGKKYGKLSFIDLAGSERGSDVKNSNKQTRIDGAEINKSLLALKECIRALDQGKKHLPFRGSKLTLVLKDSFIGKCSAIMIGNISPSENSSEHTLNTLRYADRVKELKSGSKKKGDPLMLMRRQRSNIEIIKEKKSTTIFEIYDVNKDNKKNKKIEFKKKEKSAKPSKRRQKPESDPSVEKKQTSDQSKTDENIFDRIEKDNSNRSEKSKNNFLKNQKTTNFQFSTFKDNSIKSKLKKNHSFLNEKPRENFKPGMTQNTFLAQKIQKSESQKNFDSPYTQYSDHLNNEDKQDDFVQTYGMFLDDVVTLAKSDMRVLQCMKLGKLDNQDFEQNFNKMRSNLDKRIRMINKFKKRVLNFSQPSQKQ